MSIFSGRKRTRRLFSLAISAVATSLCSSQVAFCIPFKVKISEFFFDSEKNCFYILCFDMRDISRTIEKKMTIDEYKCYFTSDCCDFVKKFPPQNCCAVEDKIIDLSSPVNAKKHLDELKQKFMDKFGDQILKRRLLQYIRDNNCESNPELEKETVDSLADSNNETEKYKQSYYNKLFAWSVDKIEKKFMEMINIGSSVANETCCNTDTREPALKFEDFVKTYRQTLAKMDTRDPEFEDKFEDFVKTYRQKLAEQKKICCELDIRDPAFEDKLEYFARFVKDSIRYEPVMGVSGISQQIKSKVNITRGINMVSIEVTL